MQYNLVTEQNQFNNGEVHVKGELFTDKEVAKLTHKPVTKKVEVSCKKTYFFFGARFAAQL